MRWIVCLMFTLTLTLSETTGQTPVGSWSDHLVYNSTVSVCASEDNIYASTGASILVYNYEYDELRKMSRINGLTETGISAIAWSEKLNTLVIAYQSTNIDLVRNNQIYNVPDIARKYIPGAKEIHRIRIIDKYAYLACSFGIVIIDLEKKEIYDTWKPGQSNGVVEVWDLAFSDSRVFAATSAGIYSADLSVTGLAYYANWHIMNGFPDTYGKFTSVLWYNNRLYANYSLPGADGDIIYSDDGYGNISLFSYTPGIYNRSFDPSEDGFLVTSSGSVRVYDSDGILRSSVENPAVSSSDFKQAAKTGDELWIADYTSGLLKYSGGIITPYTLPGPVTNNAFNICSSEGRTIITGGGTDASWNNLWRDFQVSVHEGAGWFSADEASASDAMRSVIDPEDKNHFFVSSWGTGLLEFRDNQRPKQYSYTNSPLQTIIPGRPYVRICGLAMDKNNYLWMTQSEVQGSLKILRPDGTWIVNPLTIGAQMIGDIIIARNGLKWIILPRGNGLFVFDDNNTPEIFTDDSYKKMYIEESDGNIFSYVYSIAEDLEGNIWVGTDQGPVVYYNPEKVLSENIKAFRIRIPRNDGTNIYDYMLGKETITSIQTDGANRKWLGTANAGAYLLSPDGTMVLKKYTVDNSPLLSNSIASIAVDNKTGDVWFGTSKGVQSVRGEAIEGLREFINVYAFPNPVRPDFNGSVTITGLMRDTDVKITDVSGNLVYETISAGGQASWDLKTYNGRRVSSGVYIAFCSGGDGNETCTVKILVMK